MKIKEGKAFEEAPPGCHLAVCYGVVDLGTQTHTWQEQTRTARELRIFWELPNEKMKGTYEPEKKGQPYMISRRFTASLHPKATLRAFLEGWRGKKFEKEELQGWEVGKLINVPCQLTLVKNGDYIDVSSATPLAKGMKKPAGKLFNEPLLFSLEAEEYEQEVFERLGKRTQETIMKSPEWAKLEAGGEPAEPEAPEPGTEGAPAANDDVPF